MYTHSAPQTQGIEPKIPAPDHPGAPTPIVCPITPADRAKPMTAVATVDFLARVVAPGNYIAIVYKFPDKGMSARFFPRTDIASAVGYANYVSRRGADVWFGLATYRDATPHPSKPGEFQGKRTQENAQALRAFWLDADISRPSDGKAPGKAFADEAEFETWLTVFLAATGMPRPLIVNSGYGRHCYWILENALSRDEWQPYAEALKAALIKHGAKGDASITTDAARILRLPGTFNLKVPSDPKPVGAIREDPDNIPNELIIEKLKPYMGVTAPRTSKNYSNSNNVVPFQIPGTPPALFANRKSSLNAIAQTRVDVAEPRTYTFARIAEECPQVKQSLAVGGKDDNEPVWYLGNIRLASFCRDGEHYAHEIGKLHPKYTQADTDARFKRATNDGLGAPLCEKFNESRTGVCQRCPHFGKIKSPIVLGFEPNTTVVGTGADQGNPSLVTTPLSGRVLAVAPVKFDAASLYPIDWRVRGLLLCGDLTVLAGQGGGAKTAFALYVAIAGAAGRQFVGPYPINNRPGGLRALFLSAEENQNRTGLLVAAAANSLALTASERALVAQNLIMFDARANNWRIGKPRPGHREEMVPEEFDQTLADLKVTLAAWRIDILIIDTFAHMFAVPSENDNNTITDVLNRTTRTLQGTNCAALILHHSPKMTRAAAASLRGEATSVRGAGALTYTPRVSLNVTSPDADEAGLFALHGINPKRIRRIDSIRITDLPDADPVYFQIRSERVKVHDGSEHEIRTIEFLPFSAGASGASAAGGITNAARNVVMTAVDNGTRDKQGAKVPLSPGGGRDNTRDAIPVITQALQNAYSDLDAVQATALAKKVLDDLLGSGCVVKKPLPVPKYKSDNSLNGHQSRQGFECQWELAPWVKHDGGGTDSPESSDAGVVP